MMPIHTVIRAKRKELGLTQEQVALALGVTTPAVNKWEKGATYPDISLLAPLARLLGVDLNDLLCFQEGLSPQELSRFAETLGEAVRTGGVDAAFALGLKKAREYPNCGALAHTAALVLDGALMMSALRAEEKKPYEARVLELYERAADCGEEDVRTRARYMLCSKYMALGDCGRAGALLEKLPERGAVDKRTLQAALLMKEERFSEAAALLERKLLMDINEVQMLLLSLAGLAAREGGEDDAEQIAALSRRSAELFGLGEYHACLAPLETALARRDAAESVALLDRLLSAARGPWGPGKSPLYRHIAAKESGADLGGRILPALLAELEQDPKYDFLRSDGGFRLLLTKYRAE